MWNTVVELVELLIAGYEMSTEDFVQLLEKGREQQEGHYLEAKQGHPQKDRINPCDTIRRYLSGFANSDGGILLLGVSNDWDVVGYTAPGNSDAAQWAANCLQAIAPYFSPLPRFQVVTYEDKNVLVAAAARSLNYVPVVENARQYYYLRFYDQTRPMHDWQISDLMLGRRAYPYLQISAASVTAIRRHRENIPNHHEYLSFDFDFEIENSSLVWADEVSLGIIGWDLGTSSVRLSNYLLSYITVHEASPFGKGQPFRLKHNRQTQQRASVDSFSTLVIGSNGWNIPLKWIDEFYMNTWKSALYILARETPPVWFQLSLTVDPDLLSMQKDGELPKFGGRHLNLEKVTGGRPVIAWNSS